MPDQLPSGRWRGRVRHPQTGEQVNVHKILGGERSFATCGDALAAEQEASTLLREKATIGVTLREFWQTWTTDLLWLRPAESSNIHNKERTAGFVKAYGDRPIRGIGDDVVAEWLKGGRRNGTVPALRALFNDAMKAQAGRLVSRNPFAGLGLKQSKGRANIQPPSEVEAQTLISLADELTTPAFAAYLHFAIFEGTRPGEGDALRWTKLDLQASTVLIDEQWNVKAGKFTTPKHGVIRTIAMTDPARERLLTLPRDSEFVFTTTRGTHFTPSARTHHWNRVRAAAGLGNEDLYTCTRHYFAWYAWNVLRLTPEDIADHLGHQDGGELVRKLYGHFDSHRSRDRVREAFAAAPTAPTPLRRVA